MTLPWRALAVALVAVALAVTAWGLFDAVEANRGGDNPAPSQAATTADLRVSGFGDPQGLAVSNLTSRNAGTTVTATVNERGSAPGLLTAQPSSQLLALTRPSGELVGLTWLSPLALSAAVTSADGGTTSGGVLSPQTTARSLIALAPGVLDNDPAVTERRLDDVTDTAEFDALVAEVARAQDLRVANVGLEQALARALDRLPGDAATPAPGCDAAAGSSSATAAGTCVIALRTGEAAEILNGQSRWVGVFAAGEQQVCAVIPPRPASVQIDVPAQCPLVVDLAAPGSTPDASGPGVSQQVRVATALTAFSQYGAPFAELILGAPQTLNENQNQSERPLVSAEQVNTYFVPLTLSNADIAAQLDSMHNATVPVARKSSAMLSAVRAALAQPGLADAIFGPGYAANTEGAALLSLYERALIHRTGGSAPVTFSTPGWERVDMAELFERVAE